MFKREIQKKLFVIKTLVYEQGMAPRSFSLYWLFNIKINRLYAQIFMFRLRLHKQDLGSSGPDGYFLLFEKKNKTAQYGSIMPKTKRKKLMSIQYTVLKEYSHKKVLILSLFKLHSQGIN
jgi:hypothetical protein